MADLTLKELLDATDAVLGDDGGKHRLDDKARKLVLELRTTRTIVDMAQVAANCWGGIDGCVLVKSGKEWAKALDDLRAALADYVDPESTGARPARQARERACELTR